MFQAADSGTAVLIVEQHAELVLGVADRAYVLLRGMIELEGTGTETQAQIGEIERRYLGACDE